MNRLYSNLILGLLLIGQALTVFAQEASIQSRIIWLPIPTGDATEEAQSEALRERILAGMNLQAVTLIPSGNTVGADLLDPNSVEFTWAGKPLERFVYYKKPDVALFFALADPGIFQDNPKGELAISARLIPSGRTIESTSLFLTFKEDELTSATLSADRRSGRPVRLIDSETLQGIDGAYLFGQRREDLWGKTNADGIVVIDAPTRSTPGPHYAWSPDHWTTSFDPLTSPTITLRRIDKKTRVSTIIHVVDTAGRAVSPAVALVDEHRYEILEGGTGKVQTSPAAPTEILFIAAGYHAARLVIKPGTTESRIVLEPTRTSAPPQ